MSRIYLNREFRLEGKCIEIPYTDTVFEANYINEKDYQKERVYECKLMIDEAWQGKVLLLTFEGVAHKATLSIGGTILAIHECGYTAFTVDISNSVSYGKENTITLKVESSEELNIPPFGNVIDYLTYDGIYRDVYLDVKESEYIKDVFVHTKGNEVTFDITKSTKEPGIVVSYGISYAGPEDILEPSVMGNDMFTGNALTITQKVTDAHMWDIDTPHRYRLHIVIMNGLVPVDEKEILFGIRDISFKADGFYLNGKKTLIRGLNRHQSYPYVGYAAPESLQRYDARLLKEELHVNAVRTSHYPQSHYFLDECDRIGLLVFTEFPGWQHIGDETWQKVVLKNEEEMIIQYRNHPSIILWGVRINESPDCDSLYEKTNALARQLDPTRPTGGVRCIKKSKLYEDVYTYNDFIHEGDNEGVDKKVNVTPDAEKPYLVSEYNGHMYPTKSFDDEAHRTSHAIRHARVLNDVAKAEGIAGSFGWCMFDYNTHKDFGSGDRICYHGVMDMWRNMKDAAYVYASAQDEKPVLHISSGFDIGEHPAGRIKEIYAYTNADFIVMYKNGKLIKKYRCKNRAFDGLSHPPVLIDDMIGNQLMTEEGLNEEDARDFKEVLKDYQKNGMRLSARAKVIAAKLMYMRHYTFDDAFKYFEKYIGNWGGKTTEYTFKAVRDGKVVAKAVRGPVEAVRLVADCSSNVLHTKKTYDCSLIRIRAVDQNGNVLHYYNDPIRITADGGVSLLGPVGALSSEKTQIVSLKGGMGGALIRTDVLEGNGAVTIEDNRGNSVKIQFTIEK